MWFCWTFLPTFPEQLRQNMGARGCTRCSWILINVWLCLSVSVCFIWVTEPSKACSFQPLWSRCFSFMNIHEGFRTRVARTWDINIINFLSLCSPSPHWISFCSPTKLPWKSLTSIIEYYYMWKTTDRYVQQVRTNYKYFQTYLSLKMDYFMWRGRWSSFYLNCIAS